MRCITLAESLRKSGHEVNFICRNYPGNLIAFLKEKNFLVHVLPFTITSAYHQQSYTDDYKKWLWIDSSEDANQTIEVLKNKNADWLIVDHYALDNTWEEKMRFFVDKIMVIDDLANRNHDCDILLDQNYYTDFEHRYHDKTSSTCRKLLGPKYALIKDEIILVREKRKVFKKNIPHSIHNILIYMGGADPRDVTTKIIRLIQHNPTMEKYHINVLVGSINPHKKEIFELCSQTSYLYCHEQSNNYFDLLAEADLSISAGGSSLYERYYLGIPCLVSAISDNQIKLVADIHHYGAHYHMQTIDQETIASGLQNITDHFSNYYLKMTNLIDGLGVSRVNQAIKEWSAS